MSQLRQHSGIVAVSKKRVCVIGAGVVGMSIALEASEWFSEVYVFDPSNAGSGISGAALGSLTPDSDESATEPTRRLARLSVAAYPDWLARLETYSGCNVAYCRNGLYELALNQSEWVVLQEKFNQLSSTGAGVELLGGTEARQVEPNISENTVGVLHYFQEPFLDTSALLRALEESLRKSKTAVLSGQSIGRVESLSDGRVKVDLTSGPLICDSVIVASGHGLPLLMDPCGIPLRRLRGEVVEVQGPPGFVRRHLYRGDGFFTPRPDGRLLLGSTYVEEGAAHDVNTGTISVAGALSNLRSTAEMVPGILDMQIRRVWKNWRAITEDGQPILGPSPIPNVYLALGFAGLGVTLSVGVALETVKLLKGEDTYALGDLGIGRFA